MKEAFYMEFDDDEFEYLVKRGNKFYYLDGSIECGFTRRLLRALSSGDDDYQLVKIGDI